LKLDWQGLDSALPLCIISTVARSPPHPSTPTPTPPHPPELIHQELGGPPLPQRRLHKLEEEGAPHGAGGLGAVDQAGAQDDAALPFDVFALNVFVVIVMRRSGCGWRL